MNGIPIFAFLIGIIVGVVITLTWIVIFTGGNKHD